MFFLTVSQDRGPWCLYSACDVKNEIKTLLNILRVAGPRLILLAHRACRKHTHVDRWEDPTDLGFIRRFLGTDAANSYVTQGVYTTEEVCS